MPGFLFASRSQTGDCRSRQPGNANGPKETPALSSQRAREEQRGKTETSPTITTLLQPDTTGDAAPLPQCQQGLHSPHPLEAPQHPGQGGEEARQGARTSIPTQQVTGLLTLPVGAMQRETYGKLNSLLPPQ